MVVVAVVVAVMGFGSAFTFVLVRLRFGAEGDFGLAGCGCADSEG